MGRRLGNGREHNAVRNEPIRRTLRRQALPFVELAEWKDAVCEKSYRNSEGLSLFSRSTERGGMNFAMIDGSFDKAK